MDQTAREAKSNLYTAGAIVSPRQSDLTWTVGDDVVRDLFAVWKSLSSYDGTIPPAAREEYGGCFLRYKEGVEIFAYGGIVTMMTRAQAESRRDTSRSIERLILRSSPDGLLPDQRERT